MVGLIRLDEDSELQRIQVEEYSPLPSRDDSWTRGICEKWRQVLDLEKKPFFSYLLTKCEVKWRWAQGQPGSESLHADTQTILCVEGEGQMGENLVIVTKVMSLRADWGGR